jgi:SAM-dependent methyltransferase
MAIIDKERFKNLYNANTYAENTNNWEDSVSVFRADALLSAIRKGGIANELESILDVGCGSGGVLAEVSQAPELRQATLCGLDISETAVAIANKLAEQKGVMSRVQYGLGSIEDHPISPRESLICLIHVLEHCPDMLEMIELCSQRANYLYINVPLELNVFYAIRPGLAASQYRKYGHVHFFDEQFFVNWLESNGYELIASVYSRDYMISKPGLSYNTFKILRRVSENVIGQRKTARLLAGLSGGYLVRKKH